MDSLRTLCDSILVADDDHAPIVNCALILGHIHVCALILRLPQRLRPNAKLSRHRPPKQKLRPKPRPRLKQR